MELPFPEKSFVELDPGGSPRWKGLLVVRTGVSDSLVAANTILQEEFGVEGLPMSRSPERVPLWPSSHLGSITHKSPHPDARSTPEERIWAALVGEKTNSVVAVGIDLERVMKHALVERLTGSRGARWGVQVSAGMAELGRTETEIWTTLFSIFESAVKCVGNAQWKTPLIPESFELLELRQGSSPQIANYLLRTDRGRISGEVHFQDDWVLSLACLTI